MGTVDDIQAAGKSFFARARKAVVAAALGIPAGAAAAILAGEPVVGAIFGAVAAAVNSVAVYVTSNEPA